MIGTGPRLLAMLVLVGLALGCTPSRSSGDPDGSLPTRPDILLISIDTLRADRVSAYGYDLPTTPFVDQLAGEGVLFSRAYSTSSWTVPALVSMLTSSYPSRHGMGQSAGRVREVWSVIPGELPNLVESMKRQGYRTYGLTANFGLPVERGFGRGFDRYECVGAVDLEVVRRTLDLWLPELAEGEPWFVWLHLFDPHAPYLARPSLSSFWPESKTRFRGMDGMPATEYSRRAPELGANVMEYVRALYDSEVRHVDDYLRELFELLPRADDALVVFTADHGEEFLEHGGVLHGRTLYEESVRVPLIFRFPDRRFAGTVVDEPVSLVDIFPTLLHAVGADAPGPLAGANLLGASGMAPPRERIVAAELLRGSGLQAGIGNEWKYVHDGNRPEQSALYELSEDPGERINRIDEATEQVERFQGWLAGFVRDHRRPQQEAPTTTITPEQREALEALGYIDRKD